MIEDDAVATIHAVTLAVIDRHPVAVHFGHAIGAAGIEAGRFPLGGLLHFAEHFTAAGLVKTNPARIQQPDRFQHTRDANGSELAGQDRLLPARGHKAHGRQVIDLDRLNFFDHFDE